MSWDWDAKISRYRLERLPKTARGMGSWAKIGGPHKQGRPTKELYKGAIRLYFGDAKPRCSENDKAFQPKEEARPWDQEGPAYDRRNTTKTMTSEL